MGLPGAHISSVEILPYQLRECLQPGWRDGSTGMRLSGHTIEGRPSDLPLLLQRLDPLPEVVVEVDDALLDRPIQPLETIVAVGGSQLLVATAGARTDCAMRHHGKESHWPGRNADRGFSA